MPRPKAPGDDAFTIRPANSVAEVRDFWWPQMKELGWNRDSKDAQTHYHSSRNGADWLMLVSKDGKSKGCCVAFTYPNGTGWVGFFIVDALHRGNGHGRALFQAVKNSYDASNTTVVGLDGVEEQVSTYRRRGFEDVARIKLMTRPALAEYPGFSVPYDLEEKGEEVVNIDKVEFDDLRALDLALNGLDRRALWSKEALFSREDVWAAAIMSRRDGEKRLVGFVLVRQCERGQRIGPLYAESYDQAAFLLRRAMESTDVPGTTKIAEVFGSNAESVKLFENLGWTYAGIDYHRMWLGGRIPKEQQEGGLGTRKMYAIFDASEG